MLEQVESFIAKLCEKLRLEYGGYHTVAVGTLDGEKCPEIAFHVGAEKHLRVQPATGDIFEGTGVVLRALVGSKHTVVRDEAGKVVGDYQDLTRQNLFPGGT